MTADGADRAAGLDIRYVQVLTACAVLVSDMQVVLNPASLVHLECHTRFCSALTHAKSVSLTTHCSLAIAGFLRFCLFFLQYKGEEDMKLVKQLVDPELSEPYSIFTYRLFLTPWPQLCHFCYVSDKPAGVVVCKVDDHKSGRKRGYIGMIVVLKEYRKYGIGPLLLYRWPTDLCVACFCRM